MSRRSVGRELEVRAQSRAACCFSSGRICIRMPADPNDAVAAFTEYAADRLMGGEPPDAASRGVTLMVAALLLLARSWSRVAARFGRVSRAVAIAVWPWPRHFRQWTGSP